MKGQRAFTLIELLIVVALVAIVLVLAAPAFGDFILLQRLKGTSAQLVTDLQNARSEAVTRGTYLRIVFASDSTMTCYSLYVLKYGADASTRCNCLLGPGAACTSSDAVEVRTVQIPKSTSVQVVPTAADPAMAFDNLTGGLLSIPSDQGAIPVDSFVINTSIDSQRTLRTTLSRSGRPSVCGVAANLGAPTC